MSLLGRAVLRLTDCSRRRLECRVRYPSRNICVGMKHCECWDDVKGCIGIIRIRESFNLTNHLVFLLSPRLACRSFKATKVSASPINP